MEVTENIIDSPEDWVARHIRNYVETGGAKGHHFHGYDALLLTTRGRKSGQLRRTALYYGRHGNDYIIVASNGGAAIHPLWLLNVQADPQVIIQVGADVLPAHARIAGPDEKPELWELMVSVFPTYASYQRKTKRDIPVVILTPVA